MEDDQKLPPLTPALYEELRRLAGHIFRERGRAHHTMQPTMLLHEAWAKLSDSAAAYESEEHFKAVTALAMRQILVDRARQKASQKRGNNAVATTLNGLGEDDREQMIDMLDLERVLEGLEAVDPRAARTVVLRTYGGMTVAEIAKALGTSPRSVERAWRFGRIYLARNLKR